MKPTESGAGARRLLWLASAAVGLFGSSVAMAAFFQLSAAEWSSLPEYCQVRFHEEGVLPRGLAVPPPSQGLRQEWRKQMGLSFVHTHHHCAGAVWLQRARTEPDPKRRADYLRQALVETTYTYERYPRDLPFHAVSATQMGVIHTERREFPEARGYFAEAIDSHPGYGDAYLADALVLQQLGDLDGSQEVLEQGLSATSGASSSLHYALGLLFVRKKDLDKAQYHATEAYRRGYPLPALRRQLAEVGRPIDLD